MSVVRVDLVLGRAARVLALALVDRALVRAKDAIRRGVKVVRAALVIGLRRLRVVAQVVLAALAIGRLPVVRIVAPVVRVDQA